MSSVNAVGVPSASNSGSPSSSDRRELRPSRQIAYCTSPERASANGYMRSTTGR